MESRPNVYQVLKEACNMLGREVPIQDVSRKSYCLIAATLLMWYRSTLDRPPGATVEPPPNPQRKSHSHNPR
jgi:hypothetical protein